jgi:hypothetical protein
MEEEVNNGGNSLPLGEEGGKVVIGGDSDMC